MKSGPTLQIEDVDRVKGGPIKRMDLFTIRKGELVYDPIEDTLTKTDKELIKIRERESGGCVFYDREGAACGIYESRPAQCAALACWDPEPFMAVYGGTKAKRTDIVWEGVLLRLMEEHENRCSYRVLEEKIRRIEKDGERTVEEVLGLLKFDLRLRPLAAEKLGIGFSQMDFLFGRPLIETIRMFGLRVIRRPDGTFFLTTLQE